MSGDELEFIRQAFESNYIAPLGPMVDAFEREFAEYVGMGHCLALASGTAAMHLALRELGVGPGDEVLASTLTFIGSVSPACFQGATLAFIDSDRDSWCMNPDLLAEELAACAKRGKIPKAVVPTDLYGQCADLKRIGSICDSYGIPVIADAAEAMGAFYKRTGVRGEKLGSEGRRAEQSGQWSAASGQGSKVRGPGGAGRGREPEVGVPPQEASGWRHAGFGVKAAVFSFNGNKIITTSGGGMLASEDKDLIEHARKLSQQARDPAPHYEHSEIGYNYRMSNVLAAIGRGQLRVLDQRVAAKRRIFEAYQRLLGDLPGLEFMPEAPYGRCNRWLTVVLIRPEEFGATHDQVRLALEAENIEARPVWKPMHLQPVFRGCRIRDGKVGEHLFRCGLCLPSGTAMTDSDLERVAQIIQRCHC
jgi:dTDP-4-amino-4,6-dideoxygalactose transaminase